MKVSSRAAMAIVSLFLAVAANAQEQSRVILKHFPLPTEASACQKVVSVSGIAHGADQVRALLDLPESSQPSSSLAQLLAAGHLKPLPESSLALGKGLPGAYLIPAASEVPDSTHFVIAALDNGRARAFLLTLGLDPATGHRSVALSTFAGDERYSLDLATGNSYYSKGASVQSASSWLACLWSALVNGLPSLGTIVCAWDHMVGECLVSVGTECLGVVAGVLSGIGCASGVDIVNNALACFSLGTGPVVTSLSPGDGATVTVPFSISCQASGTGGLQTNLLFDSSAIATCYGSSCNGTVSSSVANTGVQHVVTCTATDGTGLGTGQSHGVWVKNAGTTPAAPSNLSASTLSASSIRFFWQDNSSNETAFVVQRWNGSSWPQIASVGANVTSYTDTGLAPGTTYFYRACATNSSGSSCSSNYAFATTLSGVTPPAIPSNLSASALSSSSIRFSWQDNSNNETGFAVYRWNGSNWPAIGAVGANVTSYTDSGLRSQTTYYYAVCSYNAVGYGCTTTYAGATTR